MFCFVSSPLRHARPHPSTLGQEQRFIFAYDKPFFLIKMCDMFSEAETKLRLTPDISYFPWTGYDPADTTAPLPTDLVARIIKRVHDVMKVSL